MKLGIFGGAFNPIHYGHLRTAEEVLESLRLHRILFIPSGKPPFDKPDLVAPKHRYNMVKMAIKGNPLFSISDIEIKRRVRSYTVDTLKRLKKEYKDDEFYFILGIDAFLDLQKWKRPGDIIRLTNMIIISRPGFRFTDLISSPYLKGLQKRPLMELDNGSRTEFSYPILKDKKTFLCRVTELNISASCIRELIKESRSINYLLPDSVKSYIISHGLYQKLKVEDKK